MSLRGLRLLAVSLASLALGTGCGAEPTGGSGAAPEAAETGAAEAQGDPAPDFTLPNLQGQQVALADFRGKTVVIDFWATWCPPCVFQVPELNKLWQAHRDRGDLVVIGVAIDVDGAEVVGPWVAENGVEYTIVLGDESLAEEFGALGFPTLALVTAEGRLDSLHVGLIEYDELETLVAPLTAGQATPES